MNHRLSLFLCCALAGCTAPPMATRTADIPPDIQARLKDLNAEPPWFTRKMLANQTLILLPALVSTGKRTLCHHSDSCDWAFKKRLSRSRFIRADVELDFFDEAKLDFRGGPEAPVDLDKFGEKSLGWRKEHQAKFALLIQLVDERTYQTHKQEEEKSDEGKVTAVIDTTTEHAVAELRLFIIRIPDGNLAWYGRAAGHASMSDRDTSYTRGNFFESLAASVLADIIDDALGKATTSSPPDEKAIENAVVSILSRIPGSRERRSAQMMNRRR